MSRERSRLRCDRSYLAFEQVLHIAQIALKPPFEAPGNQRLGKGKASSRLHLERPDDLGALRRRLEGERSCDGEWTSPFTDVLRRWLVLDHLAGRLHLAAQEFAHFRDPGTHTYGALGCLLDIHQP
jgi:hypothetical protein